MLGFSIAAPRSYQEPTPLRWTSVYPDYSTITFDLKLWFLSLKESVARPMSQWRGDVSEGELAQEMTDRR
jgi:hypothetical protein